MSFVSSYLASKGVQRLDHILSGHRSFYFVFKMSNNFNGNPYDYQNNQQQSTNEQSFPQVPTQQPLPPSIEQQPSYGAPSYPPAHGYSHMRQMQQPIHPPGSQYYLAGSGGTPIPQQSPVPQQHNQQYPYTPQPTSSITTEQPPNMVYYPPNPMQNQQQMYQIHQPQHHPQSNYLQPNYPQQHYVQNHHIPPQNQFQRHQAQHPPPQGYMLHHSEDASNVSGSASAYSSQQSQQSPYHNQYQYHQYPPHNTKPFNEYQARENARKVFRAFDTNKNGDLDLHEFMEALRRLALAISYHEALNIFQRCDRNFDGRIGEVEFIDLYVSAAKARHNQ